MTARLPSFVPQLHASECAIACLAMVLAQHGRAVGRKQLRRALGIDHHGASALAVLRAARRFGLRGRGVRLASAHLDRLGPGAILHWEANHFVVLEQVRGSYVWILDPALGRRRLDQQEVARAFCGLALELEPDPDVAPSATPRGSSPSWRAVADAVLRGRAIAITVLASSALVALGVAMAALMEALVARALDAGPRLTDLGAGIVGLMVAVAIARTIRQLQLRAMGRSIEQRLSRELVGQLLRLPWAFVRLRTTEDLARRIASVRTLESRVVAAVRTLLTDAPMVAAYFAVLWAWSSTMACTALALAFVQAIATSAAQRSQEHAGVSQRGARAKLDEFEHTMLRDLGPIKEEGRQKQTLSDWVALRDDAQERADASERTRAAVTSLVEGYGLAIPLCLMAVGAYEASTGALTIPAMVGANCLAVAFVRPVLSVLGQVELYPALRRTVERLDDVLGETVSEATAGRDAEPNA